MNTTASTRPGRTEPLGAGSAPSPAAPPPHLLSCRDLGAAALRRLLEQAIEIKRAPRPFADAARGRVMAMLFEKPSLRTRVSFEAGFARLGGTAISLDQRHEPIGARESVEDTARTLARYADLVVARVHRHSVLETFAAVSDRPVINALSDRFHPCQALADFLTLLERGLAPEAITIAFVGDGNNVCHSLMETAALLGASLRAITPAACRPDPEIEAECRALAEQSGGSILWSDALDAAEGVDAVYTDTPISMGEADRAEKRALLARYAVTPALMRIAGPGAVFMHCLPAHRGEEVDAAVIDGPASVVFDQAENRMHAQNALLLHLLGAI
jgi:ornithine carbamoyltransferase